MLALRIGCEGVRSGKIVCDICLAGSLTSGKLGISVTEIFILCKREELFHVGCLMFVVCFILNMKEK